MEDPEPVVESSNPISQKCERKDSFASAFEIDQEFTDDRPQLPKSISLLQGTSQAIPFYLF